MVTDFSAEDNASSVKFCTMVYPHPRQGIPHFGEPCSPKSPKSDELASHLEVKFTMGRPTAKVMLEICSLWNMSHRVDIGRRHVWI